MRTGQNGRIAISWGQTEIDGLEAAPLAFLAVGAAWSWRGQSIALGEVDAFDASQTGYAGGMTTQRSGAGVSQQGVRGYSGGQVVLTNGAQRFTAELVVDESDAMPTLVFENGCPPRDQDFWICEIAEATDRSGVDTLPDETVISFPIAQKMPIFRPTARRRMAANSLRAIN